MKISMFPTTFANATLPAPDEWLEAYLPMLANGTRLIDLSEPGARDRRRSFSRKAA